MLGDGMNTENDTDAQNGVVFILKEQRNLVVC